MVLKRPDRKASRGAESKGVMCYLCMKDIELGVPQRPDKKKERAKELKRLIAEIESTKEDMCSTGEVTYEALRDEQYTLAREL